MNTTIRKYLDENGYESIKEWAYGSDYTEVTLNSGEIIWVDEQGYQVDIDEQLLAVIEGLDNA